MLDTLNCFGNKENEQTQEILASKNYHLRWTLKGNQNVKV